MYTGDHNDAEYWDERYKVGDTGWDLGGAAPPFVDLFEGAGAPAPGRVAVLCAGRGHDALFLARLGFDVVAVDFADLAVEAIRQLAQEAGVQVEAVQHDMFALPSELEGSFDYVLEHTCFCAIDPSRKADYVQVVRYLLKPGGKLIGLFFAHGRPGGPPFTTSEAEVREMFGPYFEIERLEVPVRSVQQRQGNELLGVLRKVR